MDSKRNVLITGAAGNLGKVTVERFAKEDYRVIGTLEPGKDFPGSAPSGVTFYSVDLNDENVAAQFVDDVIAKYGTIDAALLLVGGFAGGGVAAMRGKNLREMIALNVETAWSVAGPVFQQMLKQDRGGRMVFVGARAALEPSMGKDYLAYSLSKSLLFKLAEFLNAEGRGRNFAASVVVPGTIDTPANRSSMPSADFSKWVRPEDIAEVMAFLSSRKGTALAGGVFKLYGNS